MKDARLGALLLVLSAGVAAAQPASDLRRSELTGPPSDRIVRRDIDGDGKPDMVERWWNGKRVRWLDENGDLRPTDTRGDQVADVLQVDMNGDGYYDGVTDQNVKWADNDGDGRADVQAWSTQPPVWGEGGKWSTDESHWMLFLDVEKDGVLGWQDWRRFDFGDSNWAHDEPANWKPDYHGDALFMKIHRPPQALPDPRLNWENPFAFYDTDGDGLTEMAMRWLDPMTPVDKGISPLSGVLNEAFLTFDLDNDSGKGNEIDYDMSLRGTGGPGVPYRSMGQSYPALRGNPKFDRCFQWGNWRQVDQLFFMPHDKGYDAFFGAGWKTTYFVYDEDDDDHRWERVEMYYPMHGFGGPEDVDIWSTKRWRRGNYAQLEMADEGQKPGLGGHPQADSLGDRGEFDRDNSGGGQLYVGVFDRKIHLAGAEWGAWTVDRRGEFHGGWKAPGNRLSAPKVEEVVRYDDTDGERLPRHGRVRLRRRPGVRLHRLAPRLPDARRPAPRRRSPRGHAARGVGGTPRHVRPRRPLLLARGARRLQRRLAARSHHTRDRRAHGAVVARRAARQRVLDQGGRLPPDPQPARRRARRRPGAGRVAHRPRARSRAALLHRPLRRVRRAHRRSAVAVDGGPAGGLADSTRGGQPALLGSTGAKDRASGLSSFERRVR